MDIELYEPSRINELIFRFLPIGVVAIDRRYRILTTNGTARRLLAFRDPVNDQDFLHTARGLPYAEVRVAIDNVFSKGVAETLPDLVIEDNAGVGERYLNLYIAPVQVEEGPVDLAVIVVEDGADQIQMRRRSEVAQSEQTQLLEELGSANVLIAKMNKELQDANEELMLAQQKLQETSEEFEATNYSYLESLPALRIAQESGIPVIFCSSKTCAEIEHLRKARGVNDPLIVEKGCAIFVPEG